jgi:asparagine synthase (glutamine-hydrolysing)
VNDRSIALTDVDIAAGMAYGYEPDVPLQPTSENETRPRAAMEAILLSALQKPPCVISFSGGRDSSAMMALALHVARREGLALPIAATLRVSDSVAASETDWQELVATHLDLQDWVQIAVTDQLDVVGPVATRVMSRHGLLWPFNVHFHVPILEIARGGTLVTGAGGDEVGLSTTTAYAERAIARRRFPSLGQSLAIGLASAPRLVRAAVFAHRHQAMVDKMPWLTPLGRRRVARVSAWDRARIPLGWNRKLLEAIWRARYFRVCRRSFDLLATDYDVRVVHPFTEPGVLMALASAGGFAGLGSRTSVMEGLFGDLLPTTTLQRTTKATFDDATWTEHARRFARSWSGKGVPEHLVNPEILRRHWLERQPRAQSTTLMQVAWLCDHGLFRRVSNNVADHSRDNPWRCPDETSFSDDPDLP